jgi:heme/copper-type cytochrome/quinol oxidase subunit 3
MTLQQTQPRDYFSERLSAKEREAKRLERETRQTLENRRLGLLVFQISWFMAFIALTVVNWQLRFSYESWPPPGVKAMGVALPTLATVLLLAGVLLARRSRKLTDPAHVPAFARTWVIALASVAAFVAIMAAEWLRVETGTQYSAVFRLMTGFHSLHAVAVGVYMAYILRRDRGSTWAIESSSKMLDFVFAAWLLFYVVLYWWRTG